jgi:hypothetical protein
MASVHVHSAVTASRFQPFQFGPGLRAPLMIGASASILIVTARTGSVAPDVVE